MKPGQDLYDITSNVLLGMRNVLKLEKPDWVFVHGDTTTSSATALAAYYQQIPVAHIEAGLRTHDIYSPWPEEINRQITGRIATLHFAPTQLSKQNLMNENIAADKIVITGNTVIDALQLVTDKINKDGGTESAIIETLEKNNIFTKQIELWKKGRKLVLITGHRRENFGDGFLQICRAIRVLAVKHTDVDFLYPVHLNPNVKKPVYEILGLGSEQILPNILLIEPLDYLPFVYLMGLSNIVLTDSGGIQEEAPGLGKPVLVMRNTTERPEAIKAGTVKLVGTDQAMIETEVSNLLNNELYYQSMSKANNPYGDGNACKWILEEMLKK